MFHPATPEGEGGIAVVELYGDKAEEILSRLFRPLGGAMPREGEVRLGVLTSSSGEAIDEVLVASVPPRASWCGLRGWVVSSHGGALVQQRIGFLMASEGGVELSRRALVQHARWKGALGFSQGEALILLPEARTERAARYLLRMARGELSEKIGEVHRLLETASLERARKELQAVLGVYPAVKNILHPRRILISGRPNAGKSYLFNRLAERERAAVTPMAGTTRDLLEETVAVAGYPVVFIDSSGLREEAVDPVEREGMRRARTAVFDSLLFLMDRPGSPGPDEEEFMNSVSPQQVLLVRTKADLYTGECTHEIAGGNRDLGSRTLSREAGWISAKTGAGLNELRGRIAKEWLGPPEEVELPPAPFTEGMVQEIQLAASATSVDAMSEFLVKYLPDLRENGR